MEGAALVEVDEEHLDFEHRFMDDAQMAIELDYRTPQRKISHTEMIHYVCDECEMTAQGIFNEAMSEEWQRHMYSHTEPGHFHAWTWSVFALPF